MSAREQQEGPGCLSPMTKLRELGRKTDDESPWLSNTYSQALGMSMAKSPTRAIVQHEVELHELRALRSHHLRRQPRWRLASRIVNHPWFDIVVMSVILLHAAFIYIETETSADQFFRIITRSVEALFLLFYFCELALRFCAVGPRRYAQDCWNWADILLVMFSVLDVLVLAILNSGESGMGDAGQPLLVIVRLMRILRLLRLVRMIQPLWLIVSSLSDSLRAIAWSMLLLTLIIYFFALLIMNLLGEHMNQPLDDGDNDLRELFGGVAKSMFTMFQIMTFDNWPSVVRSSAKLSVWTVPLIIVFILCTSLSVLNVVMGIFVEGTISASRKSSLDKANQIRIDHKQLCAKFTKLFRIADADSSGALTRGELDRALETPEFVDQVKQLKITTGDLRMLFESLDVRGTNQVNQREFIETMLCASGATSKKDFLSLCLAIGKSAATSHRFIEDLSQDISTRVAKSQKKLAALAVDAGKLADLAVAEGCWRRERQEEAGTSTIATGRSRSRSATPSATQTALDQCDL